MCLNGSNALQIRFKIYLCLYFKHTFYSIFWNNLATKYFGSERSWWRLFQKRVVRNKFDD
jgi:hypothetical protein